jgi:hypothetical protein
MVGGHRHDALYERFLPLDYAKTVSNRIPVMTRLLELGVDVNSSDELMGWHRFGTHIHYAIREGHLENVPFLLENGADPKIKN